MAWVRRVPGENQLEPAATIDWNDYVRAISSMHGLKLSPKTHDEVVMQLRRIEAISAPLLALQLDPKDEPAPVFRL